MLATAQADTFCVLQLNVANGALYRLAVILLFSAVQAADVLFFINIAATNVTACQFPPTCFYTFLLALVFITLPLRVVAQVTVAKPAF